MNSRKEIEKELRRNQNNLVVIGYGVIAFGIWSAIKVVLYTAYNTESYAVTRENGIAYLVVFCIVMFITLSFTLCIRLYVGLSAVNEGQGRKKRIGYIVLALIMATSNFTLLVANTLHFGSSESIENTIVTIIVELSSCVVLTEMAVFAIKVKCLGRMLEKQES